MKNWKKTHTLGSILGWVRKILVQSLVSFQEMERLSPSTERVAVVAGERSLRVLMARLMPFPQVQVYCR